MWHCVRCCIVFITLQESHVPAVVIHRHTQHVIYLYLTLKVSFNKYNTLIEKTVVDVSRVIHFCGWCFVRGICTVVYRKGSSNVMYAWYGIFDIFTPTDT